MPVGLLTLELHIPDAQSLKDKRQVLRSLKDRLRAHFNVSVAELDASGLWTRATARNSWAAEASRTKESASQSTPAAAATAMASRSRRVTAGIVSSVSGRLIPLLVSSWPPTSTRSVIRSLAQTLTLGDFIQ